MFWSKWSITAMTFLVVFNSYEIEDEFLIWFLDKNISSFNKFINTEIELFYMEEFEG